MPFIPMEVRKELAMGLDTRDPVSPGELCYLHYHRMMQTWRENPRWSTVDAILEEESDMPPEERAKFLAFLVFFALHVMPYEEQKRKENGDI